MKNPKVFFALVASITLSACARSKVETKPVAERDSIEIRVNNENWGDITLYVARSGGGLYRIGNATTFTPVVIKIPYGSVDFSAGILVYAKIIGSKAFCFTPELYVSPDQYIELTIDNTSGFDGNPNCWASVFRK